MCSLGDHSRRKTVGHRDWAHQTLHWRNVCTVCLSRSEIVIPYVFVSARSEHSKRGVGVELVHYLGDGLWRLARVALPGGAAPTSEEWRTLICLSVNKATVLRVYISYILYYSSCCNNQLWFDEPSIIAYYIIAQKALIKWWSVIYILVQSITSQALCPLSHCRAAYWLHVISINVAW